MPLGLFLKVGGKSENNPKCKVCPDAVAPSRVTVKLFAVDAAEVLGLNLILTCFHDVVAALTETEDDTKDLPAAV
jgi:hypothetical protein